MINDQAMLNQWFPVERGANLADEQLKAVMLLEQELVLVRLNGEVSVFKDQCVHRGSPLSRGCLKNGHLACPYHSWEYDATGKCVRMPAHPDQKIPKNAKLTSYHVQERYGFIWVCLGEPESEELFEFKQAEDPDYRSVFVGSWALETSAFRVVENFLDISHFPYVHSGRLGDENFPEVKDYKVEANEEGVVASEVIFPQPRANFFSEGMQDIRYTYRVKAPTIVILYKESTEENEDPTDVILLAVMPVTEEKNIAHMLVTTSYGEDIASDEEVIAFNEGIFLEDAPIINFQKPKKLPLELDEELHQRSDQTSIVFRRWLKKRGITYGTTAYKVE